jgi:hypothetical protein
MILLAREVTPLERLYRFLTGGCQLLVPCSENLFSVHKRPEPAILQGDNWSSQLAFCWLAHKRLSIKPIPITVTHLDFMFDAPKPMFFHSKL